MLTDCWRCGRTWLIVSCLVNILNLTLLTLLAIIPGIHKIQDHKADNNSVLSYFGFWFGPVGTIHHYVKFFVKFATGSLDINTNIKSQSYSSPLYCLKGRKCRLYFLKGEFEDL